MNCNEATLLVHAYADGELDALRGHAIERHLRACASCARRHGNVLDLRARLRAEVPYFPASPALRERIRATLETMQPAETSRSLPAPSRWAWLTGGALAGCAATVLSWFVATALITASATDNLAIEAVTAHVQATLDSRLIQVASSDQHTVKPWLSARLDYSPPVPDLSSEGFTLVGGRLDTLQQHTVATLVYRYRLHTIAVFVRPASERSTSVQPRAVRGFNVAREIGSGMDWVAVSDASPDVLTGFVHRLARAEASP